MYVTSAVGWTLQRNALMRPIVVPVRAGTENFPIFRIVKYVCAKYFNTTVLLRNVPNFSIIN